jgi:hypothetical protein
MNPNKPTLALGSGFTGLEAQHMIEDPKYYDQQALTTRARTRIAALKAAPAKGGYAERRQLVDLIAELEDSDAYWSAAGKEPLERWPRPGRRGRSSTRVGGTASS